MEVSQNKGPPSKPSENVWFYFRIGTEFPKSVNTTRAPQYAAIVRYVGGRFQTIAIYAGFRA